MSDVLIRNFPAEDLALLDEHAARLGISRTEFLRRQLQQEARRTITTVSTADLVRFAQDFPDLADDEVMRDAWS
ncbi:ribbon-helix-helix protein, CopG family [Rhodococcus sp. NPDC057014]|uniref:type II toxin-antitoxin system VapB family antitoxin n=1 Tax=unclassified Rhodococcus (in: high G+C Gram-positive bacteria) TaxID=192944 RepID=UPI001C5DE3AA|nr:ribbon-helix-helix protein, CopG family [Rhodococcus sp. USK10]QYA99953.1 ribbon-helix-helix protein, CopG family [Rhodococcus sp. USK10]